MCIKHNHNSNLPKNLKLYFLGLKTVRDFAIFNG